MFAKTLSKHASRALGALGEAGILDNAYLAGGTALALWLGHRVSVDLDFFTQKVFDEKVLLTKLSKLGKFERQDIAWRTLLGTFMGVKFSCLVQRMT